MRAYGYVPDTHDKAQDPSTSERFGSSQFMPVPSSHSLLGLIEELGGPEAFEQQDAEGCVGWTFGECIDVHLRANRVVAPRSSGLAIWTYARLMTNRVLGETVEQAPLVNVGVMPLLAARGMTTWGVPSVEQWPIDLSKMNDPPSLKQDEQASAFRVRGWHRILSTGPQRLADMRVAIASNCMVAVGASIDNAFTEYTGGVLRPTDPDNVVGRHMFPVGEYDGDSRFRGFNHWGRQWGEGGHMTLSADFLLSDLVTDLVVVTGELVTPGAPAEVPE